jgi:cathepsin D
MNLYVACTTQLTMSFAFGGPAWPVSAADLNLGSIGNGQCLGAIFDLTGSTSTNPRPGEPVWIIGDTFLVRSSVLLVLKTAFT